MSNFAGGIQSLGLALKRSQCARMDLNKRFLPKPFFFFKVFFRLRIFFSGTKIFFQGTTFVQFFMYCKAKKNFGAIRKILKIFIFDNLLHKKCLKGGISIYADFGPPRYVL